MSTIERITAFFDEIGLRFREDVVDDVTVMPGVCVRDGVLLYERAKLLHPGDLLHEAGHLAVMTRARRAAASGRIVASGGAEMGAIAWSYAAAVKIGLDPRVVFHGSGYVGGSESLIVAYESGAAVGSPILRWLGLTAEHFPAMLRWTNDTDNEP